MSQIGEAIISLKTELANFKSGIGEAKTELKSFGSFVGDISSGLRTAGVVLGAFAATGVLALKSVVGASMEAEKAQNNYAHALKTAGDYTDEAYKHGVDYSSALQILTGISDETILSVRTLLVGFGAQDDMLDKLTKSTLDLARFMKIDFDSAAKLIGRTINGTTGVIRGLGDQLEGTAGSTQKMQSVVNALAKLCGGAAESQMKTFGGQISLVKEQLNDVEERIGAAVIPTLQKFLKYISDLIAWFNNLSPATIYMISNFGLLVVAIASLGAPILLLFSQFAKIKSALETLYLLILMNPFIALATAIGIVTIALTDYLGKQQDIKNSQINMAKTTDAMIKKHNEEITVIKAKQEANKKQIDEYIKTNLSEYANHELIAKKVSILYKENEQLENDIIARTKANTLLAEKDKQKAKTKTREKSEEELDKEYKTASAKLDLEIALNRKSLEDKLILINSRLSAVTVGSDKEIALLNEKAGIEKTLNDNEIQYAIKKMEIDSTVSNWTLEKQREVLTTAQNNYAIGSSAYKTYGDKIIEVDNKIAQHQRLLIEGIFTGGWKAALQEVQLKVFSWKDNFLGAISSIQSSFVNGLSLMAKGGEDWKNGVNAIVDGIRQAFIDMITKAIVGEWLTAHNIMKVATLAWKVIEIGAAAAVGAARAAAAYAWTFLGAIPIGFAMYAAIIAMASGFADGVNNFKGGLALVGEQGAELVNLPRGSDVIPANRTNKILTEGISGGEKSGNNEIKIVVGDIIINGDVDKNNIDRICERITEAIKGGSTEGIRLAKTVDKEGSFRSNEAF